MGPPEKNSTWQKSRYKEPPNRHHHGHKNLTYSANPRMMCLLWASVTADFDRIIEDYLCSEEWDFLQLAKAAKKWNIGKIFCWLVVSKEININARAHILLTLTVYFP